MSSPSVTILILSANPDGSERLRLDEEKRDIEAGLERSRHRHQFRLVLKSAVRTEDLRRVMLDVNPQMVHFCGDGKEESGLVFAGEQDKQKLVSADALAGLFKQFAKTLKCVVLNACYSEAHAEAIAQHIPSVIGMNGEIGDRSRKNFAVGFYDGLGAGWTIKSAYDLGCNAIQLDGNSEEHFIPILKEQPGSQDTVVNVSPLVEEMRSQIRPQIQRQCGTMRVLDMTQPIALTGENGIYTNVNILEKLAGRRRLELADLLKQCDVEKFDRFGLSKVLGERVSGLKAAERHPKLMVLGKPGAGKTTFLKYLAMQCITGQFAPDRLPLFVTLKAFAETENRPSLLKYLKYLGGDRITPVLEAGKALILLDGLDEVREEDTQRIIRQIEQLANEFHNGNTIVITCRIAAKEYTFGQFTEVEVADFDDGQINTFAQNWFRAKGDADRAKLFWQKLKENQPIKELATSPLLLTLLCLIFEEAIDFPANRSELYKEGLDILLKKWDGKRQIGREAVYKNLSLKRKEDLLSQIALTTFANKDYFFKQRTLENHIADFIRNLPDAQSGPDVLHLDSEAVLKSIEAHHGLLVERAKGIYSFSHLTFQEYFAAREIAGSRNLEKLRQVASHITEPRWREVFLLSVGMMQNADEWMQLIKWQIDRLLGGDEELQQFLVWVHQKSSSVDVPYKPAAVRAFYFACALALALARDFELQRKLQKLRDQLPDTSWENRENRQWWQVQGRNWTAQLRAILIEHRNIGHDWQFTDAHEQLLQQYCDANRLLVQCLNSDCYVSREVRQEIEETLLLPMSEIEKTGIGGRSLHL